MQHTKRVIALSVLFLTSCVGVRSAEIRGTWLDIIRVGSDVGEQTGRGVPEAVSTSFGETLAMLDLNESVDSAVLRGVAETALAWYERSVAESNLSPTEKRIHLRSAVVFRLAID